MSETIADFPAYRIYRPYSGRKFRHGEVIALPFTNRIDTLWHFFTLGSVAGYAVYNGECPIKAVAETEARNALAPAYDQHELYWVNANAVSLTAWKRDKTEHPGFAFGDTIIFQGHAFRLDQAPNNNVKLVPVENDEDTALAEWGRQVAERETNLGYEAWLTTREAA